jgi:hypothetical protein
MCARTDRNTSSGAMARPSSASSICRQTRRSTRPIPTAGLSRRARACTRRSPSTVCVWKRACRKKIAPAASFDSWKFTAYAWSEDQYGTTAADPAGMPNVLGMTHDIPSRAQCKSCHEMPNLDAVNGFGAIQLNHLRTVTSLDCLIDEGLLVNGASPVLNVSPESARIPGDHAAQAALGDLHTNCGHCHGGPTPRAGPAPAPSPAQ